MSKLFENIQVGLHIDCETLALHPDAHILQVGFCAVNLITGSYYMRGRNRWIDPAAQVGRVVDPDTVRWWLKQDPQVRAGVWCPKEEYTQPEDLFTELEEFIQSYQDNLLVWVRGNKDGAWLESLWGRTPWKSHRQLIDMRTLITVFDPGQLQEPIASGNKHDAAADAEHQAEYLCNLVRLIRTMDDQAQELRDHDAASA